MALLEARVGEQAVGPRNSLREILRRKFTGAGTLTPVGHKPYDPTLIMLPCATARLRIGDERRRPLPSTLVEIKLQTNRELSA